MTGKANGDLMKKNEGRFDLFKWSFVLFLVIVGVYGNYYFSGESMLYRVLALLALSIVALLVSVTTVKGGLFWKLIKDAKVEIRKVVWPNRQEALQTTLIVVVVVLIMGLVLWGIDSLLGWGVSSLIGWGV